VFFLNNSEKPWRVWDCLSKGFSNEFLELLDGKDAKIFMGGQGSILKRIGVLIKMARAGMRLSKDIIALQHHIQMDEKPDRIIYHPKCNYSVLWGMANRGKSIMASPIPGMAHSIDHLTVLWGNYGRLLNRLSFWIVNTIKCAVLKKVSRRYRNDYDGLEITVSSIKKAMLENEKTFYTISPALFPRPDYLSSNANVVGYYERDKTVNWQPDETLYGFCPQISELYSSALAVCLIQTQRRKRGSLWKC
jgi:sterol 3beta-glucosyltransferase